MPEFHHRMIVAIIDEKVLDAVYIDIYIECNYRAFFLILFFFIDFAEKKLLDYILCIFNGIFCEKDSKI